MSLDQVDVCGVEFCVSTNECDAMAQNQSEVDECKDSAKSEIGIETYECGVMSQNQSEVDECIDSAKSEIGIETFESDVMQQKQSEMDEFKDVAQTPCAIDIAKVNETDVDDNSDALIDMEYEHLSCIEPEYDECIQKPLDGWDEEFLRDLSRVERLFSSDCSMTEIDVRDEIDKIDIDTTFAHISGKLLFHRLENYWMGLNKILSTVDGCICFILRGEELPKNMTIKTHQGTTKIYTMQYHVNKIHKIHGSDNAYLLPECNIIGFINCMKFVNINVNLMIIQCVLDVYV